MTVTSLGLWPPLLVDAVVALALEVERKRPLAVCNGSPEVPAWAFRAARDAGLSVRDLELALCDDATHLGAGHLANGCDVHEHLTDQPGKTVGSDG